MRRVRQTKKAVLPEVVKEEKPIEAIPIPRLSIVRRPLPAIAIEMEALRPAYISQNEFPIVIRPREMGTPEHRLRLSAYVPRNIFIYMAAYSGALAGMGASPLGNRQGSVSSSDYTTPAQAAGAFAQAFDTQWGGATSTILDEELTWSCCAQAIASRTPMTGSDSDNDASAWTTIVQSIIALVQQGDLYVASQGITPPEGSGVNSITGTEPIVASGGSNVAVSILPATEVAAGSMSAADKAKLDNSITTITGLLPIVVSGEAIHEILISVNPATDLVPGTMSAADKTKLDGLANSIESVTASAPLISSGGLNPNLSIVPATDSFPGSMSAADKTKLDGIIPGAAVSAVTGTAPIVSSGGATPTLSITPATDSAAGSLSAGDKTKLDGISAGAAVATVTGTAPIVSSGGQNPALSIVPATDLVAGSMSAADKTKLDAIVTNPVESVTATAPLASSGGVNPNLSIAAATDSIPGSMSAADKTKLDGMTAGASVAAVTGTAPIVSSGGANPAISITPATDSAAGSLSAGDKTKLDGISAGAAVATVTGTAPIVSSGGQNPALSIIPATDLVAGSMSAADKTKLDNVTAGAAVATVTGTAPIVSSGGQNPALSIIPATDLVAGSMSAADKTKLDGISGNQAMTIVRVNSGGTGGASASPYAASPYQQIDVDSSTGNVSIVLPVLTSGQWVDVQHDQATSLAVNTVSIHGPGPDTTLLAQPVPNNQAAFISPFVYGGATAIFGGENARGLSLRIYNGGSANGYLTK
jgi:hypothetical protein